MSTLRIGLFGLLGSGNLGNDGSLEAVLRFLRTEHPDAELSALCGGPDLVAARYGIATKALHWYGGEYRTASGVRAIALKGLGKLIDVFRTYAWVRRQDVVIVPGMGVLEATLPLRPWGFPYSMFLLCASARLAGTKVALVSVGANVIGDRATRTLVKWAARLASYRSYRDTISRDAMTAMGVDTSADEVYPDLVFALPTPVGSPSGGVVGVGVMAFRGDNDERDRAEEIYRSYVDGMKSFVGKLVERGRPVRLFHGDQVDTPVLDEIIAEYGAEHVSAAPLSSLDNLMQEMAAVDTVVATRFHNVLCALKMCRPTLSVGYAEKNDMLMAEMGLAQFRHPARHVDAGRLFAQFTELEERSAALGQVLAERNAANTQRLKDQFAALSAIFPGGRR
ncbi:polysaccharide pyruvyl transferase family protein [Amycolatopsis sp.]|uniref:polysaccharide pyruvyl transferase family protein n=1 Tax=Amycolatopsis sp. TaxID=37632 RepID=UPI002D1AA062|nr:polysaccharide pyruvyl transferase family protein [Amycolatopsis sp.]HVV14407.1 polysaccharide pyruvyl transferase family protein [Amycolatopsis sp.]